MQNTETLLKLGFKKIPSGEYLFRGKKQKFVATVSEDGSKRAYVNLFKIHPEIDKRENSPKKGCHFRAMIKDCISNDSVKKAIIRFDKPESDYVYIIGGVILKSEFNPLTSF